MRTILAMPLLLALLGSPALAGEREGVPRDERQPTPGEQLDRALEDLGAALEALIGSLPYGAPRTNERGDIVIPRRDPPAPSPNLPPDMDRT